MGSGACAMTETELNLTTPKSIVVQHDVPVSCVRVSGVFAPGFGTRESIRNSPLIDVNAADKYEIKRPRLACH